MTIIIQKLIVLAGAGIIENFKNGVSKSRINIKQGFGGAAPDSDKLHMHVNFIATILKLNLTHSYPIG